MENKRPGIWILIGLVMAMSLAGCGGPQETAEPRLALTAGELVGSEWVLMLLNGESLLEGTAVTLTFHRDDYMEGDAGCNTFGANFELSDGSFAVAEIHRTLSACPTPPGIMEQEGAFFTALSGAARLWGTDDSLELEDADGELVLVFARKQLPTVDPLLLDTEWLLGSLNGQDLLQGTQITLNFGQVGLDGYAGCNRYGSEYEAADEGILATEMLWQTEMECPTPAITNQEQAYIDALGQAAAYRVVEDRLEIDDAAGETLLVYVRKETASMDPTALVGTQWQLFSLDGSDLVEGSTITLAFHNEYRAAGHAGCRDYVAIYQASSDDLGFLFFAMIEADCTMPDAIVEQEGQYTTLLGWAADYRLGDGQLEIVTERGEVLVFAALPQEANAGLEETPWALTAFVETRALQGIPVPQAMPRDRLPETEITLTFSGGQVSGSTGCNTYSATYAADEPLLAIEQLSFTEMACLDPEGTMEQEQRFLGFLHDASTYRIHGEQLWLETDDGRVLVFRVQDG